jgi:hypothetical protein
MNSYNEGIIRVHRVEQKDMNSYHKDDKDGMNSYRNHNY